MAGNEPDALQTNHAAPDPRELREVRDLRGFLALLERHGELLRIDTPVSPKLEITEIADRMVKHGGPALLFDDVEGSDLPVAINLFGSRRRMAWRSA